jgi:hypothetical protein
MSAARASAPAAVLEDGRVLLTGNDTSGQAAELYDPDEGTFTATAGLTDSRFGAAAVRLLDGRVLVVGGVNATGVLESAEIYDAASGVFASTAGPMATRRLAPAATALENGFVLIAGGHNGQSHEASAELFDPRAGTFVAAGRMNTARVAAATRLMDGTVLIAGGEIADRTYTRSAERYDPALDTFVPAGYLTVERHGHEATLLADGRVLLTGGLDNSQVPVSAAELYDPANGTFRPAGRMATARVHHRAVRLSDGSVLILGGTAPDRVLNSAEIYDPATDTFTAVAPLAEARSGASVATLMDGRILVAGGRGPDDRLLAGAEIHDGLAPPKSASSTRLVSNRKSSLYGEAITFTATVTGAASVPRGTVAFYDAGTLLLGSTTLSPAGVAALTTTQTPAGVRSITAVYGGSGTSTGSTSTPLAQSVSRSSTTATLAVTPIMQQYSDRMTFEVKVSGANGAPPARGVTFRIGTQEMNAEPVPFQYKGGGVWTATLKDRTLLETSAAPALNPNGTVKIVTAVLSSPSQDYSTTSPTAKAVIINKEDARVTYDGDRAATTSSRTSSTATVTLKALVRDIAVTSEGSGDTFAGDIRRAQVTFINRATGAIIGTVIPSLVDASDSSVGVATHTWKVDIGLASSKDYTIGTIVSNYYGRNNTADNTTIRVTRGR